MAVRQAGEAATAAGVAPSYGAASLAELLPALGAHLGVPGCADRLGLPPSRAVAVLLVDGLGADVLAAHPAAAPTLTALARPGRTLSTGFPSTTPTSLACLASGLPAGEHGVLGLQLVVGAPEGLDPPRVMNVLRWDAPVDPVTFAPRPTIFERAEHAGVAVTTVGPRAFRGSGLTVAGLRGGGHVGADSLGELAAGILDQLRAPGRRLVYGYHGDLDATGHRHGVDSPAWRAQLSVVDRLIDMIVQDLPADTSLYVTGDHGMVDVPRDARIDVADEPELQSGVELVAGEPRALYLTVRPGAREDVLEAWRGRLGEDFWVLSVEQADQAGWFGGLRPEMAARVGDIVVAARGKSACVDSRSWDSGLLALIGMHGSLTHAERVVPLLHAAG
jgi:predicted AlkP superfamily pyrophosphatase or phosphodiesterase